MATFSYFILFNGRFCVDSWFQKRLPGLVDWYYCNAMPNIFWQTCLENPPKREFSANLENNFNKVQIKTSKQIYFKQHYNCPHNNTILFIINTINIFWQKFKRNLDWLNLNWNLPLTVSILFCNHSLFVFKRKAKSLKNTVKEVIFW